MKNKNFLLVGKIVAARGLLGEIKIDLFCDSSAVFLEIKNFFSEDEQKFHFTNLRPYKNQILAKIENENTREGSLKYIGRKIYAKREDIPTGEDRYFIEDLKGLEVVDFDTKKKYGILKDVLVLPTCDAYEITSEKGKEYLLPILKGTVKEVNFETGEILINPQKGIFDDEN